MPTFRSPQVGKLIDEINVAWAKTGNLERAILQIKDDLRRGGLDHFLAQEFEEACAIIRAYRDKIEVDYTLVRDPASGTWYRPPYHGERHWPAVKDQLARKPGWTTDAIASLDSASTEVVSLLGNPYATSFSCRGLVLGHVQSGKTANMTAVIAKAVDTKYNFVLVLTGLTNKLRYQTQSRLMQDLRSHYPMQWEVLTPDAPVGDFRAKSREIQHRDGVLQLAAVKKNVSPLRNLLKVFKATPSVVLERLRILVIDDECDQASVNTKSNSHDMTAINGAIRQLLEVLPAVSYVGYTATPFANVLISPYAKSGEGLDDLYPKDFITALPTPAQYFGAKKLFGIPPMDAEKPTAAEEGLDMIRPVPEEDVSSLQPATRGEKDDFHPEMCGSLQDALLYFFACCAARRARGHGHEHMTMLVHTSPYIVMHNRVANLIQEWAHANRFAFLERKHGLGRRLEELWEKEHERLSGGIPDVSPVDVNQVFAHLGEVLAAVEFPVENGSSDDRIDYSKDTPRTYVVVGGTILSRGLTLKGLMVSYFLRATSQYDTLLQMGRWFGYRPGYADLPRIWTTSDLQFNFRDLAAIEQEVREEIDQYRRQQKTPMDLAVRIRVIPGMAITAANKMRAAQKCSISLWGVYRQTFRFEHRDDSWLKNNWEAASALIDCADRDNLRVRQNGRLLWRNVSKEHVVRFFEQYHIHSTHTDLQQNVLKPFLESGDRRLGSWNIGIVQPRESRRSSDPLGGAGHVRLTRRARLNESHSFADIKALMSVRDVGFDCDRDFSGAHTWRGNMERRIKQVGQQPLLLLYAVDAASPPHDRQSKTRVPLNATRDVLAIGMVFPGSTTEAETHVSVELEPNWVDDPSEVARQESEQAEIADAH